MRAFGTTMPMIAESPIASDVVSRAPVHRGRDADRTRERQCAKRPFLSGLVASFSHGCRWHNRRRYIGQQGQDLGRSGCRSIWVRQREAPEPPFMPVARQHAYVRTADRSPYCSGSCRICRGAGADGVLVQPRGLCSAAARKVLGTLCVPEQATDPCPASAARCARRAARGSARGADHRRSPSASMSIPSGPDRSWMES